MRPLTIRSPAGRPELATTHALLVDDVSLQVPGPRTILAGVNLSIMPGERVAIVGPNGAGKTSLLKLIHGLLRPTSGRVLLDGEPVQEMPLHRRALRIAVVAQGDQPDLRLTLSDYVDLGRVPHRGRVSTAEHARIVGAALDRVGLSHLAARRLDNLSGGERQRGAIARAIAQEPSLLVLDEPTNHLDPRARADMLALAHGLGITVVAVLHDLALVAPFADRVAVLDGGRLVALGTPAEALAPPIVRAVFAMDCFTAINPVTGRETLVLDAPPSA